jgi:hypothetical protein
VASGQLDVKVAANAVRVLVQGRAGVRSRTHANALSNASRAVGAGEDTARGLLDSGPGETQGANGTVDLQAFAVASESLTRAACIALAVTSVLSASTPPGSF